MAYVMLETAVAKEMPKQTGKWIGKERHECVKQEAEGWMSEVCVCMRERGMGGWEVTTTKRAKGLRERERERWTS